MPPHDPIAIRRPQSPAEYLALQDVQRAAWGLNDDSYVVPVATLIGADRHGGLVLGAYTPDGRAVGFSFAFLGKIDGRFALYSQLTGILPDCQDRGLGTKLKLAQRDFALREGIDLIAWAFDPLQAGNARFNLNKLGASCRVYYTDLYGPRLDRLNIGVPTDRLLAEWEVSPPPRDPMKSDNLPTCLRVGTEPTAPEPMLADVPPDAHAVGIEIPAGITAMRQSDPERAARWALATRRAFVVLFARGYRAVDFVASDDRGLYLLTRDAD